jgi:hypothetical protein
MHFHCESLDMAPASVRFYWPAARALSPRLTLAGNRGQRSRTHRCRGLNAQYSPRGLSVYYSPLRDSHAKNADRVSIGQAMGARKRRA